VSALSGRPPVRPPARRSGRRREYLIDIKFILRFDNNSPASCRDAGRHNYFTAIADMNGQPRISRRDAMHSTRPIPPSFPPFATFVIDRHRRSLLRASRYLFRKLRRQGCLRSVRRDTIFISRFNETSIACREEAKKKLVPSFPLDIDGVSLVR